MAEKQDETTETPEPKGTPEDPDGDGLKDDGKATTADVYGDVLGL